MSLVYSAALEVETKTKTKNVVSTSEVSIIFPFFKNSVGVPSRNARALCACQHCFAPRAFGYHARWLGMGGSRWHLQAGAFHNDRKGIFVDSDLIQVRKTDSIMPSLYTSHIKI